MRNYLYFTAYGCVALLLCCNMWVFWVVANFLEAKSKLARQIGTWRAPTEKLARQLKSWRQVGAPTLELARAKSGFGARQLPHSSCLFAPRAPYTLHAFPSRHLTTLFF